MSAANRDSGADAVAGAKGAQFILSLIKGAQEDDRNITGLLVVFETLADLIAVHFWHHDIEKHQVG